MGWATYFIKVNVFQNSLKTIQLGYACIYFFKRERAEWGL